MKAGRALMNLPCVVEDVDRDSSFYRSECKARDAREESNSARSKLEGRIYSLGEGKNKGNTKKRRQWKSDPLIMRE